LENSEVKTLRACTRERRIVLKYDMAAPLTLVPVSTGNRSHDFEILPFDAVGAANDGPGLGHSGEGPTSSISNTLSKLPKLSRGEILCLSDIVQLLLGTDIANS
jgi:hypothetical protein